MHLCGSVLGGLHVLCVPAPWFVQGDTASDTRSQPSCERGCGTRNGDEQRGATFALRGASTLWRCVRLWRLCTHFASPLLFSSLLLSSLRLPTPTPLLAPAHHSTQHHSRTHARAQDNVESEAPLHTSAAHTPPSSWPEHGRIVFDNVCFRYRPELPLVLNKVCLDIQPGEKIALCGRSGSGKSTCVRCLFRLCELAGGHITIGAWCVV